jgi:hypothetical protein
VAYDVRGKGFIVNACAGMSLTDIRTESQCPEGDRAGSRPEEIPSGVDYVLVARAERAGSLARRAGSDLPVKGCSPTGFPARADS